MSGSGGPPCATLRSTFHARAGAVPGDWPRVRWDRARHRRAVAGDRDAGNRRRGPRGPRAGLALRLIIAHLIPGSGFGVDLGAFRYWASNLASDGLSGFYDRDFFHDYTPGYLYVLWLVGVAGNLVGGVGDLIKVPPILADLAIGWLAWSMVRELGGRDRLALAAAFVAVLNPVSWFDSVVWGQVDSFGVVFLLLALRELWRDRPERAAIYTVIAAVVKPQLGILIPLVAVVTIRRALWPAGGFGDADRTGRPIRILTTGVAGFVTAWLLCLPFGLSVIELSSQPPFLQSGLLQQVALTAGGYPYLTVNAYNPWALVPGDAGTSLATAGTWVCDFAGTPSNAGRQRRLRRASRRSSSGPPCCWRRSALILWVVARRPDRLTLLVGLAVLALAFFVVPTRVHERYGYPFFAVGAILAAVSWRWRLRLPRPLGGDLRQHVRRPDDALPGQPLGHGLAGHRPAIRSQSRVTAVAVAHVGDVPVGRRCNRCAATAARPWPPSSTAASLVGERPAGDARRRRPRRRWTPTCRPRSAGSVTPGGGRRGGPAGGPRTVPLAHLVGAPRPRRARRRRLVPGASRRAPDPPGPERAARARARRPPRPSRPVAARRARDRQRSCSGRSASPSRTRCTSTRSTTPGPPRSSSRTGATGMSHDIYEWTHPHLAKYAMAAGIVLWGEDHVSATSELGVPVRDAVIEPRRDDPHAADGQGRRPAVRRDRQRDPDLRPGAPAP